MPRCRLPVLASEPRTADRDARRVLIPIELLRSPDDARRRAACTPTLLASTRARGAAVTYGRGDSIAREPSRSSKHYKLDTAGTDASLMGAIRCPRTPIRSRPIPGCASFCISDDDRPRQAAGCRVTIGHETRTFVYPAARSIRTAEGGHELTLERVQLPPRILFIGRQPACSTPALEADVEQRRRLVPA